MDKFYRQQKKMKLLISLFYPQKENSSAILVECIVLPRVRKVGNTLFCSNRSEFGYNYDVVRGTF